MTKEISISRNGGQRSSFLMNPLGVLHQDMDRLLDRYVPSRFTDLFAENADLSHFASLDVTDTDKSIEIKVDVPGVDEKDIEVTLSDNILTIKGERESKTEKEKENFYSCERSFGSFVRRVDLPSEIDENKIQASLSKGVLNLHMPKSEKAKAKERKIKVKAL